MLDLKKIENLKNQNLGFFRFKKLDDSQYLITNEVGIYSFLTESEFKDFISGGLVSGDKYNELLEKRFIKRDTYERDMAIMYAQKNGFLGFGPSLHIVVTTLRCNHKCQYCHAAAAPETAKNMDMTKDTAKKVVDTIFYTSNNNITIEFQGGEPLLNWEIVRYIVEYSKVKASHLMKNVTFALVTNLTLMDEEKLDYIIENNIDISTSLDGDEETHNFNRTFNNGNSFEKVIYWINKINDTYKEKNIDKRVGALLTVTRKTLDKYKEVIDTYVGLGLDGIFLRALNPYGFATKDIEKLGYTADEFVDFYKKSMDYIIDLNKAGVIFREKLSTIFLYKILTSNDPNYLDERSPCGACIGQVAYNYDGKVYSCDEGRMLGRMGDDNFMMIDLNDIDFTDSPGQEAYKNMIDSETTKVMVQASTLDGLPGYNDSVYKPYIGVCPIYSYKMTGNIIPNYRKDQKRKLDYAVLDYLFSKIRDQEIKNIFLKWINLDLSIDAKESC
ncbi:MAG: His-Xaa-Ser system radical SAM maturase HxsB [Candidatus Gracilibacteria bacterium]|nr:His-Xaa-Ser system radical SAM maturase HxsB [Candidatus Gracilibacteria bacterium]